MNRRDALAATATLLGVTITGAQLFLSGCSPSGKKVSSIDELDTNLLDEIGETILPESASSPGARAARVGEFMKVMVADCYSEAEQKTFVYGINALNERSRETFSNNFIDLSADKKLELLTSIDKEASAHNLSETEETEHYFWMIKQLTIWGYFTSEPGGTKALRYVPVPGGYEGCVEYDGGGAWL